MLHSGMGTLRNNPNSPERYHNITPMGFHVFNYNQQLIATRTKLSVLVGYLITIHSSQGLTLDKLVIDFSDIQEWLPNGMVYFALSHCRSLNGLWVGILSKDHVTESEKVRKLIRITCNIYAYISNHFTRSEALYLYVKQFHKVSRFLAPERSNK